MKVNFQLAKYESTKGRTPRRLIICYVHNAGKQFAFSTTFSVDPNYWNQKENIAEKPFEYINWQLDKVRKVVNECFENNIFNQPEIKKVWSENKNEYTWEKWSFNRLYDFENIKPLIE